jgi:serine/threonine protein kinase/formylglycine-generating enzyme required for sulfatase activity
MMDSQNEQADESAPLSKIARVDQICDRFEQAMRDAIERAGPWPGIDDFLEDLSDSMRANARDQLSAVETYYRRQLFQSSAADGPTRAANEEERQTGSGEDAPDSVPHQIGDRYRVEIVLGEGAFGTVYRCKDEVLDRTVAVKVPRRKRIVDTKTYLAEARILAGLKHPSIIRVFDYGPTKDGLCYVVSEFIDGSDLQKRMRAGALSHRESAELAATIADALHCAHLGGVVHRDLKPANILIDLQLRPYLADFGLALKDDEYGQHGHGAGTPAYMSPEQARCEGHLVDGRSDVFSLGAVLYELLTGAKPFRGTSSEEILQRIRALEPRPPRQIDDSIHKELERICLKAMSKRASDRYNTARDMADDLHAFLARFSGDTKSVDSTLPPSPAFRPTLAFDLPITSSVEGGSEGVVKIVPKGLRSFDKEDADFFLKLLPGPHDRHGLPESIRFWKMWIAETDPENVFRVGIIYGPSGCGKSSLVKAGLLPRLDPAIVSVYLEAAGDGTEDRLLRAICRQLPGVDGQGGLVKTLGAVRRGQGLAVGDKLLLVIDQFEQWLHAHGSEEEPELAMALRQCDGIRVQCILMVRDDFWLAVSRFMQALDVRVVDRKNLRLVDLFDQRHASKVLAALGVAFGALPESGRTKEQESFLNQAVANLANDGKIIPVRLALFAEMFKGKPWTPSALRAVGGAEGVGVAFLEETFSSSAPPHHRLHQKAAQAVLAALLPGAGTDIKGHVRSREELLALSACSPRQFDEVLELLEHELRLVSPADTESLETNGAVTSASATKSKSYQLTHDYLVPALRTWLTRKEGATPPGRARLRLADFASLWTARPENRRLPSLTEYLQIRRYTSSKSWNETQRNMMRTAARLHGFRSAAVTLCLVLAAVTAYEFYGRIKANELRKELYRARFANVPAVLNELAGYRSWAIPQIRRDAAEAKSGGDGDKGLRASLALLPGDDSQVDYVYDRLIKSGPEELGVVRTALAPHKARIADQLWSIVQSPVHDNRFLRAVAALAAYSPDDARWSAAAPEVAAELSGVSPFNVKDWSDVVSGIRLKLLDPLARIARDPARSAGVRLTATNILVGFTESAEAASDRSKLLTSVLIDGDNEQFEVIFPRLEKLGAESVNMLAAALAGGGSGELTEGQTKFAAQRKAHAAIALLRLGQAESVWPLFRRSDDENARTYLIHWCRPLGVDPQFLLRRWDTEPDASARAAILLLLGKYPDAALDDGQRRHFAAKLLAIFETESDAGLHAAAQWLLQNWKYDKQLQIATHWMAMSDSERTGSKYDASRRWYINSQDQTFVVVDARHPFTMGSPDSEHGPDNTIEDEHTRRIGRTFAIATSPVTIEQFRRFQAERPNIAKMPLGKLAPSDDCPVTGMTWYEAAEYCNWLSEKDGISADQWCYRANEDGHYGAGMRAKDNYLSLSGYRLPTEAEWEFACRAGTKTRFYCGDDDTMLGNYAWYESNSNAHLWPVAQLKPNDLGLFDMHGNVWQWCDCPSLNYPRDGAIADDERTTTVPVTNSMRAALRGGAYDNLARRVRAAFRARQNPDSRQPSFGFRPARTIKAQ